MYGRMYGADPGNGPLSNVNIMEEYMPLTWVAPLRRGRRQRPRRAAVKDMVKTGVARGQRVQAGDTLSHCADVDKTWHSLEQFGASCPESDEGCQTCYLHRSTPGASGCKAESSAQRGIQLQTSYLIGARPGASDRLLGWEQCP